jgi:hypothetical protein
MEAFAPLIQQQLSKPVFMPPNLERISINCIPHSELELPSLPTASEGFLFSHAAEYCLVQEQNFMKEVNRILELASDDPKVAISDPIECSFALPDRNGLETVMKRYSNTLNFTSCCGKKEEEVLKAEYE